MSHSRPLIGITARWDATSSALSVLKNAYINAIACAGGLPVLLPILPDGEDLSSWTERLDGLLLSGGEDINPRYYGQFPHHQIGDINSKRDQHELSLVRQWLPSGKPLMGICRGVQILEVAFGGQLIQDIGSEVTNSFKHRHPNSAGDFIHEVHVAENSLLSRLLEAHGTIKVNSIHHQAALAKSPELAINARSPDGIIEGLEAHDGRFIVGVQWHPEEITHCPLQANLFRNFVAAARG